MTSISNIHGREIIDSRGNPTVEAEIRLTDGSFGRAAVPSGASTGSREAIELRDGDLSRYLGRGVMNAVKNINEVISSEFTDMEIISQKNFDNILKRLDGTENKGNLGANALLAVSMAYAKTIAASKNIPLFRYFGEKNTMPIPMMNIINGGAHADNSIDIQEFMIIPVGADSFREALRHGVEVFHSLRSVLQKKSLNTAVGDEGGFAPDLKSNRAALDVICEAVEITGLKCGKDILLGLDVASSEFFSKDTYYLQSEGREFDALGFSEFLTDLVDTYPIITIEDGMGESDWEGWSILSKKMSDRIQLVGDDLTVTNPERLQRAIDEKSMNAILIKLNQIGTVTETLETIQLARSAGMASVISHRSGETEDTTIADFAVATGVGQIKTGSICRTDRIAKYNQLLRIEEKLNGNCQYAGRDFLGC